MDSVDVDNDHPGSLPEKHWKILTLSVTLDRKNGGPMTLFLDYDGVLHPDAACVIKGRPLLRGGGELFMWAPMLSEVLADFPELAIVLSTSWARKLSYSRARRCLPPALRARVVGATWHSVMAMPQIGLRMQTTWWDQSTRYQQIQRYVARAGLDYWLAIDDQPEGWAVEDADRLVHTDGSKGLSDPCVLALLASKLQDMRNSPAC